MSALLFRAFCVQFGMQFCLAFLACIGSDMLPFFFSFFYACVFYMRWLCIFGYASCMHKACKRRSHVCLHFACMLLYPYIGYTFSGIIMHTQGRQNVLLCLLAFCMYVARMLQHVGQTLRMQKACNMRAVVVCAFCVHFGIQFCLTYFACIN